MPRSSVTLPPVTANWNQQKGKLKVKFPILTDVDLSFKRGEEDQMLSRIQAKLGKQREELTVIIAAL